MSNCLPEVFGSMVFNDCVMRERLPEDVYQALQKTIEEGTELDINAANVIANAMKDWAIEKGATHYTHWFQPMTGITAEKHDSFLSPLPDGRAVLEFSGKELIRGEPDASSFPSGGLRATFEARGYTSWDPTSYAFIKDDSLCIPTIFCSYSGEVLDKKTPLLRSNELINKQALRILRLFGSSATKVICTVGPEQEYFLIDKELWKQRQDLVVTGRTLFGARPPKGQELDDHYFGVIKSRVMEFMKELNKELWKLGVYAKTEHNETAPAQHELAPVFTSSNVASDHNQLTMEMMKKVADRHGLACLLHEKPFKGVNGSGKHNNWSLATNEGENLLKPGRNPAANKQFLVFLCAILQAVDKHQDLLRISSASAGNDHRLGSGEAPPAIVSIFLGSDITDALEAAAEGKDYKTNSSRLNSGVGAIHDFKRDTADRNRTSPLAFTGNKFEFRLLGSSFSVSDTNMILNTIVADALSDFADRLECAEDFDAEVTALIHDVHRHHSRIIFNGNNYSKEWEQEAERRGLLNLHTLADSIPHFISEKNIALLTKHGIFSESEIRSRCEIMIENYCKVLRIESLTMIDMVRKEILPAALSYSMVIAKDMDLKQNLGIINAPSQKELLQKITKLSDSLYYSAEKLENVLENEVEAANKLEQANVYRDKVVPAMEELRSAADELETIVATKYWPYPTYSDLLFSV